MDAIAQALAHHGRIARLRITQARGSTPRAKGTEMFAWPGGQSGTIGGGQLEFESLKDAYALLSSERTSHKVQHALGPNLNQCCGGAVSVEIDVLSDLTLVQQTPRSQAVIVYGAGHVAQALTRVLLPLTHIDLTVCDTRPDWLARLPDGPNISRDAMAVLDQAAESARHLIMTPKHDVDFALCDQLLKRDFAFAGLIGSRTKWARFRTRLRDLGHSDATISRITCPIGDPNLGKHPHAIAVGVTAQLLAVGVSEKLQARARERRA